MKLRFISSDTDRKNQPTKQFGLHAEQCEGQQMQWTSIYPDDPAVGYKSNWQQAVTVDRNFEDGMWRNKIRI